MIVTPLFVRCPKCGAKPGKPCLTKSGKARKDEHEARYKVLDTSN